jgi:hypothetical protein
MLEGLNNHFSLSNRLVQRGRRNTWFRWFFFVTFVWPKNQTTPGDKLGFLIRKGKEQ